VIDFTPGWFSHCAATKSLGVKSEELSVGIVESNLVVASPIVRLDEAGSEGQGQISGLRFCDELLKACLDPCLGPVDCPGDRFDVGFDVSDYGDLGYGDAELPGRWRAVFVLCLCVVVQCEDG